MRGGLNRVVSYFHISNAILFIPIAFFAIYDSVFSSFSSVLAVLWEMYPNVSRAGIQMVLAIPALTAVPATLLTGFLASYIYKKNLAIFALILLLIGGLVPVAVPNPDISILLVSSSLIGVGQGLLHPLASMLVSSYWPDKSDRSRAFGFKQAVNYLGAAIVSLIVGFLALAQWNFSYFIYLGVIPILVFVVKKLPQGSLEERLVSKKTHADGLKKLLVPPLFYACFMFFSVSLLNFAFQANIAMLVNEKGLGEVVSVAAINAMLQLFSFAVGIAYGGISKKLRKWTFSVSLLLLAIGFIQTALADSLPLVFFGSAVFGVGAGLQYVTTLYNTTKCVDQSVVSMALSIVLSFTSLGFSLSPVVIEWCKHLVFGVDAGAYASMLIAGAGCACLLVIEVVKCAFVDKSK